MFFSNVNVFVACFALLAFVTAPMVTIVVSLALAPFPSLARGGYQFMAGYGIVAVALIAFWAKVGLAPAVRKPSREVRYRRGQLLLAVTNVLVILAMVMPFVLAKLSGNPGMAMLAWFSIVALPLGMLFWAISLFMVWSSGV